MAIPISVLLVEDSKNDAELVITELRRHGFAPRFKRAATLPAIKSALENHAWQVVICDYFLGKFDAMAVLALFRKYELDIPFICVSGAVGEEVAVSIMKGGAHDYIPKSELARLGPAIDRELRAGEVRRRNASAERMAAHLAAIVENSDDAIISKDLTGTVLSWNRAAERIYGYTAREMVGNSISIIIPPDRRSEQVEILEKVAKGEQMERMETVRVCKDKRLVEVSLTISPILDPAGKVTGVSVIARDISERKRQEGERVKLITDLTNALSQVKMLSGLLPICAWCKKIRDDQGYWEQVETYIMKHAHVDFTHSICPDCLGKIRPEKAAPRTRRAPKP